MPKVSGCDNHEKLLSRKGFDYKSKLLQFYNKYKSFVIAYEVQLCFVLTSYKSNATSALCESHVSSTKQQSQNVSRRKYGQWWETDCSASSILYQHNIVGPNVTLMHS